MERVDNFVLLKNKDTQREEAINIDHISKIANLDNGLVSIYINNVSSIYIAEFESLLGLISTSIMEEDFTAE